MRWGGCLRFPRWVLSVITRLLIREAGGEAEDAEGNMTREAGRGKECVMGLGAKGLQEKTWPSSHFGV